MTKKDRKIANQEAMIKNRNKLIKDLQSRNEMKSESNRVLRFENEEQESLLRKVADLSVTCPLDSEKIILAKIKELTRDYQSKN